MSRLSQLSAVALLCSATVSTSLLAQAPAQDLSDAEVAHVAVTANTIDIEFAQVALARGLNPEVKGFATTMITDHSAVNKQAADLASRLGVTPADNAVSQLLLEGAKETLAATAQLQGSAFDRAYITREVAYHQAVLDALDGLLIPTTSNADLKSLLRAVRPAIAEHLAHAQQLSASLQAGK